MYLSMYLSMYHLPRLCHILVPEIRVRPEILRVCLYIDVLTCVIYNCTRLLFVSTVKIINDTKTSRGMRRHRVHV